MMKSCYLSLLIKAVAVMSRQESITSQKPRLNGLCLVLVKALEYLKSYD